MKTCLHLFITLATLCCAAASAAPAPVKPNVIFILADDLGIGDVSCYGSDHRRSPVVDRLAASGTRFTQNFTASLCGPSRALIMSGRYAFRNGSSNQDACMRLPNAELQLARVFRSAGYATASIGKWGQLPGEPDEVGFDDYLRFNGSGVYWNRHDKKTEDYRLNGKQVGLGDKEYLPDIMQRHAFEFIRKNREQPFFLYYPMVHVHGEIQPTPDSAEGSKDLYGDNVLYMDKLVGGLLDELDALKLRENTLIIFMGDNGTAGGANPESTIGGRALSGKKGTMLECGGLVPMIANWPGRVPAGRVSADLIDSTDFIPTFAELIGTPLPQGIQFDGHSILPLLLGKAPSSRPWIYNQLAAMWYVRDAGWKLNEKGELFDMSEAPFVEKLVPLDSAAKDAVAARSRLGAVLAELNPAGGVPDAGDGTGRHANKAKKKAGKAKKSTAEEAP
jgi:arylsulfatase A